MEHREFTDRTTPRGFSFSLREILLIVAIVALALALNFGRQDAGMKSESNAPFAIDAPVEYRYWHQIGPKGSGTGEFGSGDEWRRANGIEVFENFVILHLDDGVDRMVERVGLKSFDWRRIDSPIQNTVTPPVNH